MTTPHAAATATAAETLLTDLTEAGVELWLDRSAEDEPALRFRAPQGALTTGLRERVAALRPALVEAVARAQAPTAQDEDEYAAFPLTPVQASYLVGRTGAWTDGGTGCHGYAEFDVCWPDHLRGSDGPTRLRALETAWRHVVDCHPMLRGVVSPDGWQRVDPDLEVELRVVPVDGAEPRAQLRDELRHQVHRLDGGPLIDVAATVADPAGDDTVLHLSVDLLITDFVGLAVVLSDLAAALDDPAHPPAPPGLTFRQSLALSRRAADSARGREDRERALAHWRRRVSSFAAPFTLSPDAGGPPDAPRTTGPDPVHFTRRRGDLDAVAWQRFSRNAADHGLTPTGALLGLLARVLRRHAEADDATAAGRGLVTLTTSERPGWAADSDRVVGDFTSTALLELDASGPTDAGLAAWARACQDELFTALDHRSVSGVEVARLAARDRGDRALTTPVVVTSTVGAASGARTSSHTLRPRPDEGLSQTPQVQLDIQFSDADGGIAIAWDARDGAIDPHLLDAAFADFGAALRRVADDPEAWHGDPLPPRTFGEPEPLPAGGLSPLHVPMVRAWRADPDRIVLVDGPGGARTHTGGDLLARAARAATVLHERGAGRGATVCIALEPGVAQVSAVTAALAVGARFVPIDPEWPVARREAVLARVRANSRATVVVDAPIDTPTDDTPDEPLPDDAVDLDADAYVIFTSGSTGEPKGVVVTHRQAATTLADLTDRLGLGPDDAMLAVSRLSFDLSVFNVAGVLGAGGRLVVPSAGTRPDPESWARDLAAHRVTLWNSVPAQWQLVLDQLGPDADPLDLRAVLVSGDRIPTDLPARTWAIAPQARVLAMGGATEAGIWSVLHEPRSPLPSDARSVPYGRALRGQTITVTDGDGGPAAVGHVGEIVIGGHAVAVGYLGADDATRAATSEAFLDGPRRYRTGDLGRLDTEGRIEFLGRRDGQVKINGHRLELGEVEAALCADGERTGVADAAAAVVVEHGTPRVVAGVVPARATTASSTPDEVVAALGAAHRARIETLDEPRVRTLAERTEAVCLDAMAAALREGATPTEGHEPLVRRWRARLVATGRASRDGETVTVGDGPSSAEVVERWRRVVADGAADVLGATSVAYLTACLERLPAVLAGSVDPLSLLFVEGDTASARAVYREDLAAEYLTDLVAAGVCARGRASAADGRPLRVLEVGGGVGGTTAGVVDALRRLREDEGVEWEYTFTDVSRYFLDDAARHWPELTCQLFDVNLDAADQGLTPGSFDVIVCANVLHNALSVDDALADLCVLLAPGGSLAVIDATGSTAARMVSLEFKEMVDEFADARAGSDEAFLDRAGWDTAFTGSPFVDVSCWPPTGCAVEVAAQHLFWASAPGLGAVDLAAACAAAAERLPAHARPTRTRVLARVPLSPNGKVDRDAIVRLVDRPDPTGRPSAAPAHRAGGDARPLTGTSSEIGRVWREVLGLGEDVTLDGASDFFDLGGDSLLLARTIGQIRREIPGAGDLSWDDLLRRIVADPTIDGTVRALGPEVDDRPTGAASAPDSPLVDLLAATDGSPDVVVVVHDGSGGLEPYHALLDALAASPEPHPRVVGLRRTAGDGYLDHAPSDLLDALTRRYADAVTGLVGPGARVHLVGYCMGGLLAVAIAARLAEAGLDVGEVGVVSAYRIPFDVADPVVLDHSLARLVGLDPAAAGLALDEPALGRALRRARAEHGAHIPAGAVRAAAEPDLAAALDACPPTTEARLARLADSAPDRWTLDTLLSLRAIFVQSLSAVAAWHEAPYLGRVRFLRQRGAVHFLPDLREDMTAFWQDHCLGDLVIEDVDGSHFTCLDADHAPAALARLREGWHR